MLFWSATKLTTPHLLRTRLFSPRHTTHPYFITSHSNSFYIKPMARLTGKALEEDIANTVLEDSEPERQAEEAAIWKEQRMTRREHKAREDEQVVSEASEAVSGSERDSSANSSSPKHVDPSVIEISDTTVGSLEALSANARRHDQISSPSSEDEIQDLLIQSTQSHQAMDFAAEDDAPIDLTACISSPAEPESLNRRLDIARFAYVKNTGQSTASRAVLSLSRQNSRTSISEENISVVKPPKPIKSAAPLPSFASSFAAYQLAALSKCIVCNLAWTVRKTVLVKVSHIKSCARKNGWNEETIIKGMAKEIGHISAPTGTDPVGDSKNSKGKGKGKAVAVEAPKTFLEDVVNEAAPKKKRKKAQDMAVVTVLNPQEAHAAILERAKSLLGPNTPSPQDGLDSIPATQVFSPSNLGASGTRRGVLGLGMSEDQTLPLAVQITSSMMVTGHNVTHTDVGELPPSTQTFRPSTLAGKFTSAKRSVLYGDENVSGALLGDDTARMPPATQAFRQSGLAAMLGQTKQPLLDFDGPDAPAFPHTINNPARPSNTLKSTTKPLLVATRPRTLYDAGAPSILSSVNDELVHLPMTSQRRLLDFDRRLAGISTGLQDPKIQVDPYPTVSTGRVFGEINTAEHEGGVESIYKGKQKARSCSSSSSRSRSRSKSRSRKPSSRRKSRSPRKNQRVPEEECGDGYFSDTLDEDLHRIIKEDKVLYERILRYEPIHFDVFLKLAGLQETDNRRRYRLKYKVRTFLDKQAINFYGDSALASNRRRY